MRITYRIVVEKPGGKTHLGRPSSKLQRGYLNASQRIGGWKITSSTGRLL
jgi:hypothetical protein